MSLAASVCTLVLLLALTVPSASGRSSNQVKAVRQALIAAELHPSPLYPTRIPQRISCCKATLDGNGDHFTALFTDGRRDPVQVDYARLSIHALRRYVQMTHAQGHEVEHVRIGGRRVTFAKTDVTFFYGWRAQGFSYMVDSHYTGTVKPRDLRTMVASARPLAAVRRGGREAAVNDCANRPLGLVRDRICHLGGRSKPRSTWPRRPPRTLTRTS
jgi:hypothetical protein